MGILDTPNRSLKRLTLALGLTPAATEAAQAAQITAAITLSAAQAQAVLTPRHRYVGPLITRARISGSVSAAFAGYLVGNSIAQGTGSSGGAKVISARTGSKLAAATVVGGENDWAMSNLGVGGSTTATALAYLSDTLDQSVTPNRVKRGLPWAGTRAYIAILDLRNDISLLSVQQSALLLRLTLQLARRHGKDAFVIIDPPAIDPATGEILDTQSSFGVYADEWRRIAAEEGASVVDVHRYFTLLKASGVDLRIYYPSTDGVHPNDAGHDLIAQLLVNCMLLPGINMPWLWRGTAGDRYATAVGVYTSTSGVTALTAVSGLTTNSTSRRVQTGEASAQVFVLGGGQSATFPSPLPLKAALITVMGGVSGSFSVQYNGVNVGAASYTVPTGVVREFTFLVTMPSGNALVDGLVSSVKVTQVSGSVSVLGVTMIGEEPTAYSDGRWPDSVEAGTWSDGAITGGIGARQSATVGDTLTLNWYGTSLSLTYERGTSAGEFTYSVDGGAETALTAQQTGYVNSASFAQSLLVAKQLTEGWHTVRLTVTAKNAASSANTVKIGRISAWSGSPDQVSRVVALEVGQTVQLTDVWRRAVIERVLSGSPFVDRWVAGQSALTLAGTGAALVRLER